MLWLCSEIEPCFVNIVYIFQSIWSDKYRQFFYNPLLSSWEINIFFLPFSWDIILMHFSKLESIICNNEIIDSYTSSKIFGFLQYKSAAKNSLLSVDVYEYLFYSLFYPFLFSFAILSTLSVLNSLKFLVSSFLKFYMEDIEKSLIALQHSVD